MYVFRTDELLRHLLPRVARLGIKVGLRLIGSVKTGSVYDGTCVISADQVDILVMFDAYQVLSTRDTAAGDGWRKHGQFNFIVCG